MESGSRKQNQRQKTGKAAELSWSQLEMGWMRDSKEGQ